MRQNANKVYKLAYFVSHPIQYQAPLLKLLNDQKDIELKVFFLCDISIKKFNDPGFGAAIKWDMPLLEGYQYEFLDSRFNKNEFSFNNPKVSIRSLRHALSSQHWDAVWIHGYGNLAMLIIVYLCSLKKIPLMLRGDSNLSCNSAGVLKGLMKKVFLKGLLSRCSALLFVGTDNRDYYRYYGASDEQLHSVPLAVDNDAFQLSDKLPETSSPRKSNKIIILYASKFTSRKNPLLLIQAFNQLDKKKKDNSELWFVGEGEQRSAMEAYIAEQSLEQSVKLFGFKNQTELPWYYSQCGVFVLPAEREPFGLAINEAMNQAKAIITTQEVGAARDLVHQNENGWVIEAGSLMALHNALDEALSDTDCLETMGRNSLSKINLWSFKEDIDGIRAALNAIVK